MGCLLQKRLVKKRIKRHIGRILPIELKIIIFLVIGKVVSFSLDDQEPHYVTLYTHFMDYGNLID